MALQSDPSESGATLSCTRASAGTAPAGLERLCQIVVYNDADFSHLVFFAAFRGAPYWPGKEGARAGPA